MRYCGSRRVKDPGPVFEDFFTSYALRLQEIYHGAFPRLKHFRSPQTCAGSFTRACDLQSLSIWDFDPGLPPESLDSRITKLELEAARVSEVDDLQSLKVLMTAVKEFLRPLKSLTELILAMKTRRSVAFDSVSSSSPDV